MKKIPFVLFCFVALFLCVGSARADEILIGTQTGGSSGTFVNPNAAAAEGFYLTQSVTLTGIKIGIFTDVGDASDLYLFQLADKIGPGATAHNVLASFPVYNYEMVMAPCGPILPCTIPYLSLSVPSLALNANTDYFLVAAEVQSASPVLAGALWRSGTPLPSTVGAIGPTLFASSSAAVNTSNPSASNWSSSTGSGLFDMQLMGTPRKAPEPSAFWLFAIGLVILYGMKLRAKRQLR